MRSETFPFRSQENMISRTNKTWRRILVNIGGLAGVMLLAVLCWDYSYVGRELDRHRNIPVYDNGILFFRSRGRHYSADGYYYGQQWQCVEYIKRFYHKVKGHTMPDVWGHARDFFDPVLPDGAFNKRRGLRQYRNGSVTMPAPDDILVFRDTKYGHVGIVTKATEESVEIIQQNIWGKSRQTFKLHLDEGCYTITVPREAAGWLRLTATVE